MRLKNLSIHILILIFPFYVTGQTVTDLISLDARVIGHKLQITKGSEIKITERALYDNQPDFINEKQMAFSASDEGGNHDIIIYNFESEKFTNLTKTPERNEFSPTLTDCGLYVSAVTVEEDGKQRLWLYPTNFGEPELLYDDIEPVGYYDWYDNKAAMFVLGSPNSLVYPYSKSDIFTISQNVGRSIKRKPKSSVITYIDKNTVKDVNGKKAYALKGYDIERRTQLDFGFTYPGSEDFIWLNKNLLLMGQGNDLFFRKADEKVWQKAGEVSISGYRNITRMAYSSKLNKLVLVMERD